MILAIVLAAAVGGGDAPMLRTPNLYAVPARCALSPYHVVDRFGRPLPLKLGDLPKGALQLAVERRIDGCPVITSAYGAPGQDNPAPPPAAFHLDAAPDVRK